MAALRGPVISDDQVSIDELDDPLARIRVGPEDRREPPEDPRLREEAARDVKRQIVSVPAGPAMSSKVAASVGQLIRRTRFSPCGAFQSAGCQG